MAIIAQWKEIVNLYRVSLGKGAFCGRREGKKAYSVGVPGFGFRMRRERFWHAGAVNVTILSPFGHDSQGFAVAE